MMRVLGWALVPGLTQASFADLAGYIHDSQQGDADCYDFITKVVKEKTVPPKTECDMNKLYTVFKEGMEYLAIDMLEKLRNAQAQTTEEGQPKPVEVISPSQFGSNALCQALTGDAESVCEPNGFCSNSRVSCGCYETLRNEYENLKQHLTSAIGRIDKTTHCGKLVDSLANQRTYSYMMTGVGDKPCETIDLPGMFTMKGLENFFGIISRIPSRNRPKLTIPEDLMGYVSSLLGMTDTITDPSWLMKRSIACQERAHVRLDAQLLHQNTKDTNWMKENILECYVALGLAFALDLPSKPPAGLVKQYSDAYNPKNSALIAFGAYLASKGLSSSDIPCS